jgi:hypothetical protein
MSCGCNSNLNNLSGGANNPCGDINIVPGELQKTNPIIKMLQPKIDNIIKYAKEQVDCNLKNITSGEWQKMLISLDTNKLVQKLEPAPINTIEYAKKEFMPIVIITTLALVGVGAGIGYYVGKK